MSEKSKLQLYGRSLADLEKLKRQVRDPIDLAAIADEITRRETRPAPESKDQLRLFDQ